MTGIEGFSIAMNKIRVRFLKSINPPMFYLIAYKHSPEGLVFIHDKYQATPSGLSDQICPGLCEL